MTDYRKYVSGNYKGYNVVTYEINGRSTQIVSISASSERNAGGAGLNTYVNTLLPLYPQFKAAMADAHTVTLTFLVATPGMFVRIANDIVGKIADSLKTNGYVSGCAKCGTASAALYHVNDRYLWLCDSCAEE